MQVTDEHPLSRVLASLEADLDDGADLSLLGLGCADTAAVTARLARVESRLAELRSRVLVHGVETRVEEPSGATSTPVWLAHQTLATRRDAHRQVRLARALDARPAVRAALASGDLRVEQAEAIVHTLDELPDLEPGVMEQAEQAMLAEAARHDAQRLRLIGRHLLEVVAPEIGEERAARALEKEEREAAESARLSMNDDGHGTTHGRFAVPTLHGAMFHKALLSLMKPEHTERRRPAPLRMGQALCELLERLHDRDLPTHGGGGATVVVTMTLQSLRGGLAEAVLDTGDRLSAATARRLACEHGIIPLVLGGRSQVLDLGRRRRLHTRAQRVAMAVRDGHCTAVGCDVPPGLCHAHHDQPWSLGGRTDVASGRLLCPRHHRMVHDPAYDVTPLGSRIELRRRT